MTVTQALTRPTARIVILAEITAGIWCRAWILDGTLTSSYKLSVEDEISAVRWNRDTLLTQQSSAANVNANAGSWYWDRATQLLWVRPLTGSIFENVVQAVATFYFGHATSAPLNNRFYDPRIVTAPNLSRRIEAMFGGVAQVGGGSLVLENSDGYFDSRMDHQWNAGIVTLKIGVDTHAGDMAFADYETAATWIVEEWTHDEKKFTLRLTESKSKLKAKVPFEFFTRAAFPNIEDNLIGKPIPVVYGTVFGVAAILIDPGLKKFKISNHEVFELSEVRLQKQFEEVKNRTLGAASWYIYDTDVYRYYLADEDSKSVSYNGTAIVEAEDLADCLATANRWYAEENFTYVHPASGLDMSSGTYVLTTGKTLSAWDNIPFATKDLASGEFTLGDEWSIGQAVSVDLKGKRYLCELIENSIEIIEDILTIAGATNLNAASFNAAAAKLVLGTTLRNRTRYFRSVGLFLRDPKEVLEIVSDILEQIGAFLYSNELGEFTIGLFDPEPGESLIVIDDQEAKTFSEANETKDIISTINARFARRELDAYSQNLTETSASTRIISDQAEPVVKEIDLAFSTLRDAKDYAQRTLIYQGSPLKTFNITVPWTQWLRNPGEQVRFQSASRGVDQILEIIEQKIDLGSKGVALRLGNLRALSDAPGFWVGSSDVLPARFSTLTGYAAGSLVWNDAWDDEIKTWARQNVGYWTDANGFASSTDPDSFLPSVWV